MTSNIIVLKFVMKFLGFGYERMEHKTQITCCTATSLWGGGRSVVLYNCYSCVLQGGGLDTDTDTGADSAGDGILSTSTDDDSSSDRYFPGVSIYFQKLALPICKISMLHFELTTSMPWSQNDLSFAVQSCFLPGMLPMLCPPPMLCLPLMLSLAPVLYLDLAQFLLLVLLTELPEQCPSLTMNLLLVPSLCL